MHTARRPRRMPAALAGLACLALLATACTGSNSQGAADGSAAGEEVTITFWHGWSQESETKAINDNVAAFEKLHEHPCQGGRQYRRRQERAGTAGGRPGRARLGA